MDWDSSTLLGKAKLYAERADNEQIHSALFGFWMSLCLELLSRAALSKLHPVLLADPRDEGNIQFAFGINPRTNPRSIQAKTVFARCSVFVSDFTDQMSAHCLILADRRNRELHTGNAAFEGHDNSAWLPQTYEVFEVLLKHLGITLNNFFGDQHANFALSMLKDRIKNLKVDVQKSIGDAKKTFEALNSDIKAEKINKGREFTNKSIRHSALRRSCKCPSCGFEAIIAGETIGRGPNKINEVDNTISREVRILPNLFICSICDLRLDGYQKLSQAQIGSIFTNSEVQDPIEFFGIIPEEHVDIDKLVREYQEQEYNNE